MILRRTKSAFPMVLSPTPDIKLRLFEEGHASSLFQLVEKHRRYLRAWLPWLDTQNRESDSLQFIRIIRDQFRYNETLTLGVWYQEALCGVLGYHRFDWLNRASMIGYWLAEDFQGKGIMTESCRGAIDYGFRRLDLHRIEIRCATENLKSRAIPKRLGFVNEGIARQAEWLYDRHVDLVIYSMLAPEWKKSQH